ncbi:hypothetical protein D3C81_651070 [compost metagenome]
MHGRGHLVGTLELVMSTAGHVTGNTAQLAAGTFQLLSVVLQPADSIGKEVTQGVGRPRQAPQLILPTAVDPGSKAALAELRDVLDQLADRLDQATVDQPQAEQPHQHRRSQHHQQAQPYRALGTGIDAGCTLASIGAQLLDQFAHLLTGGTVHAFDRPVARYWVAACRQEGLAALRIGLAQLAVAVA